MWKVQTERKFICNAIAMIADIRLFRGISRLDIATVRHRHLHFTFKFAELYGFTIAICAK